MENDIEDSSGSDFDDDEDPDKIQVPGNHIYIFQGTVLYSLYI